MCVPFHPHPKLLISQLLNKHLKSVCSDRMEEQTPNTAQVAWSLAIVEQIQTTARKIHQIFYPPPSSEPRNEPTAPLLSSLYQGDDETDARREDPRPSGTGLTLMVVVKLFITLAPLLAVFFSWAIFLGIGLDPLAFGMLAFYLVVVLLGCIMLVYYLPVFFSSIYFSALRAHPSRYFITYFYI